MFQDTAAGRAHREELLKGEVREEWQQVAGTDRSIVTMLERKNYPRTRRTRGASRARYRRNGTIKCSMISL